MALFLPPKQRPFIFLGGVLWLGLFALLMGLFWQPQNNTSHVPFFLQLGLRALLLALGLGLLGFVSQQGLVWIQRQRKRSALIHDSVLTQNTSPPSLNTTPLNAIGDQIPALLWVFQGDDTRALMACNQAWCEYTGLSQEMSLQDGWLQAIHPDDRDDLLNRVDAQNNLHAPLSYEIRCRNTQGEFHYFLFQAGPYKDPAGCFVGFSMVGVKIDTQKHMQMALAECESRFSNLADSAPFMVWMSDENNTLTYMNQAELAFSGLSPEEALSAEAWITRIKPDQRIDFLNRVQTAMANHETIQEEVQVLQADQEYRWLKMVSKPRLDHHGRFLGYVGASFDIQDRKVIEQSLIISEERFRLAMAHAPIGMGILDVEGRFFCVNEAFTELLHTSEEELLTLKLWNILPPDDQHALKDNIQHLLSHQAESCPSWEGKLLRQDGSFLWGQNNLALVRDQSGKALYFLLLCQDITQQKQSTEALESIVALRTQELQESTHLLNSIIENVPAMIFLKDAKELRFTLFNKMAEQIVGFTKEEMLGKNDFDFFPPEQAEFFTQKDQETLQSNSQVTIQEEPIRTKDGETRYLKTKKVAIVDKHNQPSYLLGISEDITQLKHSQDQIVLLNQQLKDQVNTLHALNKELEAFSYSVSHDLRAPLRTIDGFSQAVLTMYADKLDERGVNYLNRLRQGSQQMGALIDDLLNLSRLSRAEMHPEQDVNLSEMAHKIAEELRHDAPDRHVRFDIEANVFVAGDARLLNVVLHNLLQNAWKYTSSHESAHIAFGVRTDNADCPVYYVQDDGVGFDMQYANKLFGAFQRLHRSSEFPGSGIGLATVQRIIHRHGGEVWAEAAPEQGATFYFTLEPISPTPSIDSTQRQPEEPSS